VRPRRLELCGFGPFADAAEVDFSALDDIFLISGKTGSGKTTIFDGMCFALYGKVPGSRADHVDRLVSDFIPPGSPCRVSLEFEGPGGLWKVERSLAVDRKKKDSQGSGESVKTTRTAVLYQAETSLSGGIEWRNMEFSAKETDAKIRDLVKLDSEEFFKIVLLPQGEFADFLRLKTNDRRKILSKLFPLDTASRVMKAVHEKARETKAALAEAERTLSDALSHVTFETYGELYRQRTDDLARAKNKESALEQSREELQKSIRIAESEADAHARLAGIKRSRADNEKAAGEHHGREEALARSRKARPLERYAVRAGEKKAAREKAAGLAQEAAARRETARARFQEFHAREEEMSRMEGELGRLRERRPFLEELNKDAVALEKNREDQAELEGRIARNRAECEALRNRRDDAERQYAVLEKAAADAPHLERKGEDARILVDTLLELKNCVEERDSLYRETEEKRKEAALKEAERAALAGRLPVLEAEAAKLAEDRGAGENAAAAARLALGLEAGKPCPVCGSVHHPLPAAAGERSFGLEERLSSLEAAIRDAREKETVLRTEAAALSREILVLDKNLEAAGEKLRELWVRSREELAGSSFGNDVPVDAAGSGSKPDFLESGKLETVRAKALAELNVLIQKREEARRAVQRLPELYRIKDGAAQSLSEKEREQVSLIEKKTRAETDAEALAGKQAELLARWGFAGVETALAETETKIAGYETAFAGYRRGREDAEKELAVSFSAEESALRHASETETEFFDAAQELEQTLAAADFAALVDLAKDGTQAGTDAQRQVEEHIFIVQNLLLDPAEEQAIEMRGAALRDECSALASAAAEQERFLAALREERAALSAAPSACDPVRLREELAALDARRAEAEKEREKAAFELTALEKEKERLDKAEARRSELSVEAARYGELDNDLCGANPKKTPFDSWLLGLYLAEVAAYATKRLERMSEGRYSLHLNTEGSGAKSYSGLDISVFDAATGKMRPCATLSGGESFLASISLALGLADSIQDRSGGVRLDAVFIDEGFGSLDDETLNKALDILDEIREARMVGLISHVGEMRARIPGKIEVVKTASGSLIRRI
jgi:exonuclease SbcC